MFDKYEYFVNRELSWLKFNTRVLNEAEDTNKPLLERLRFLAIASSNLDEFFMIRVAGLKQQFESGINKIDLAGLTVEMQLHKIGEVTHALVKTQYRYLKALFDGLESAGIHFANISDLNEKGRNWIENYFHSTIYPVVTPMGVDASHPFPFLANKTLNLAVHLKRGDEESIAVVQVPGVLPRIIEVPADGKKRTFLFLEKILENYCSHFFRGYTIKKIVPFRITRNADLSIDEEDAQDLLAEVEKSLRQRKRGQAVRLELYKGSDQETRGFLMEELKITEQDVYEITGPLDLTCMFKFSDLPGYGHLRYSAVNPSISAAFRDTENMFEAIRQKDILLHHPYESFEPVVDFVRQAANDPKVLAIKQTLYRVSGHSPIVQALSQAAENGKQVTVVVEVKARFDEENNIQWARRLEEAGCHVVYGLVGLKTHAKITLVVRQETTGIKRYVHLATGNYNDSTARIYTDLGLFTANDQFGADASGFFNTLSGYSDPPVWNKFIVAPLGLRERIYELVDREIAVARQGRPASIIAKMNSLIDKHVIMKLYEASAAGVKIDLIIRGICGVKPGIKGVSENITVRSIVGRFLEHHRIFYFSNDGEKKVYLSSADWMPRNLNERVELMFPVDDEDHIERIESILKLMLRDNQKAYVMRSDANYRRVDKRGKAINSQAELYRLAQEAAKPEEVPVEQRLKPLYRKEE